MTTDADNPEGMMLSVASSLLRHARRLEDDAKRFRQVAEDLQAKSKAMLASDR